MNKAILNLGELPSRYPCAPENLKARGFEIRNLIIRNYRVIFTITEESVHVLHVRHGAKMTAENDELEMPGETGAT